MMSINLSNIAILDINSSVYRCTISLISKNEGINLMQNADLTQKSIKSLFLYIKLGKELLTLGDIQIKTKIFTAIRLLFF